jgi:hypothetical protein
VPSACRAPPPTSLLLQRLFRSLQTHSQRTAIQTTTPRNNTIPQKNKTPQTVPARSSLCSAVSLPSGSANLPAPSAPMSLTARTLTNKANRNPNHNSKQQHNQIPQKNKTPQPVQERSSLCSAVSLPSGSANLPAPSAPMPIPASTVTNKANRNPNHNSKQQHNQIPQKNKTPQPVQERCSICSAVSLPSGSASLPAPLSPIWLLLRFKTFTFWLECNLTTSSPNSSKVNALKPALLVSSSFHGPTSMTSSTASGSEMLDSSGSKDDREWTPASAEEADAAASLLCAFDAQGRDVGGTGGRAQACSDMHSKFDVRLLG